jgi:hypothetical protein
MENTHVSLTPAAAVGVGEQIEQPNALTPEVMVFFVTICFLAIFGLKR